MEIYSQSISREKAHELVNAKRKLPIDAVSFINQGWETVQKDGNYVGFAAINFVIGAALGIIPYVGDVISNLLSLLLGPGYHMYYHNNKHHQTRNFNNFFDGFKFAGPLILQGIISGFIMIVMLAPVIITFYTQLDPDTLEPISDASPIIMGIGALLFFVVFFVLIYLTVSWSFSQFFIIYANMEPWEAMQASRKFVAPNFFSILLLLFLEGLVLLLGMLLCCIGLFWAMPSVSLANYFVFESAFLQHADDEDGEMNEIINHLV